MEFEVRESISLEDGKHEGTVVRIEYREEPYKYTDLFIKEEKTGFELRYGCPTNSSMDGKLMKLISKFGKIQVGQKIDPEKIMVGREVSFMTMQEEQKDGKKYTRIVDGSVKPKVQTETVQ